MLYKVQRRKRGDILMPVKIEIYGIPELQAKLKEIGKEATKRVSDAIHKSGFMVEAEAKKRASGRPGPNVITGFLRAHIQTDTSQPMTAVVFDDMEYAGRVEFLYPYMRPALNAKKEDINRMVNQAVQEAVK